MHSVIEHLRSRAPANAAFFRLVGRTPRGEYVLFPRDSHSVYGLGEAPRGLLPGTYQVFFFDTAGQQIQHARVELNLSEALAAELGPIDGAGIQGSVGALEDAAHQLQAAKGQLSLPLPPAALTATSSAASAQLALTREQAAHKMSLESDQQKYAFIQSSVHAREIGEAVMVNRMLRQEMMELNKQIQLGSQAAFADVEKQLAAIRLIRQAQKEVLQDLKEMETPAQPQKIDWFPLANHAVKTVSEIGVALVNSWSSSAATQAASRPAPLPAAQAAPPPVPLPATQAVAPPASHLAQSAPSSNPPAELRDQPDPPATPRSLTPRREPAPESRPSAFDVFTLRDRPESD